MNFTVIGPTTKKLYSVNWIEVETSLGNFVIQHGHAPMMLVLLPNRDVTIFLTSGKVETFHIYGGLLEIDRERALLIINE